MRWTVPCVNVYSWPSTLTGELLVVWTRSQLLPLSGSTGRASVHGSKCVLCREELCAGKQAMGLCLCLLLPFLLMEEHGHAFCKGLAGGRSLSEAASALQTSSISGVQSLCCWGELGCIGAGTIPVCIDGRQTKVWKTDVLLEKYDLVSFWKDCPSCKS